MGSPGSHQSAVARRAHRLLPSAAEPSSQRDVVTCRLFACRDCVVSILAALGRVDS
jgi:hypothetical protein